MTRQTRRRFLESSMLAATAALAGKGLATKALAGQVKGSRSPNETLRVAVLGVNNRGKSHLNGFMGIENCEVVAICDPDQTVGQKNGVTQVWKQTGKRPAFYQDLRRVMDDRSIDIVSIATPNHWHSLAAIWAMQAGKDVYVEKPVSHNIREGRVMVETARKENRICQAGTQTRSNPAVQRAMKFLQAGKLGKIKIARALCYKRRDSIGKVGSTQVPQGVDYNVWLGPAPNRSDVPRRRFHYDWHWQWDYGSGDLGNQGIHQIDIARWGLGEDLLADNVISFGGRFGYEDDGQTPNTEMSIMEYGDRLLVVETRGLPTKNFFGNGSRHIGNIFHCEEGFLTCAHVGAGAIAFDSTGSVIEIFSGRSDHYQNFVDAVRSRRTEDLNGEIYEGHVSSALCHLANISYRLGSPQQFGTEPEVLRGDDHILEMLDRTADHLKRNGVDFRQSAYTLGAKLFVDAAAEKFIDNPAANALLTRDYRKGFAVPAHA